MTGPTASTGSSGKSPGWYEDDNGLIRWWNGSRWDDAPPASGAPPPGHGAPPPPGYGAPPPPGYGAAPPPGYGSTGYGSGYPPPAYGAPYATPYASAYGGYPASRTDGRTLAMLSHLGVFIGGFVLPLVIYVTSGKNDPFVRHHSAEALNFSLFYLLFVVVGMILSLVTLGIGFILFLPLFLVFAVLHVVWAIMGAVKSSQGEWWKYPINVRFVQGAIR